MTLALYLFIYYTHIFPAHSDVHKQIVIYSKILLFTACVQ